MTRMQNRAQTIWLAAAVVLFATAPVLIAMAPNEATMGLVAKIFYFHVPAWFVMFTAVFVCGIASAVYLFTERAGGSLRWPRRSSPALVDGTGRRGAWAGVVGGLWQGVRCDRAYLELTFMLPLLRR